MDLTETTAPKSDQQQYDDYLGGITRTVTVSGVTKGSLEQPVNVELSEFPGRPFRPNKTMRRLMVLAWGSDSSAYVGRRLTLCGNPAVTFGGKAVGGVEIAAMSDIDGPLTVALTATRGKRKNFTVQPLTAAPSNTATHHAALTAATTIDQLVDAWKNVVAAGVSSVPELVQLKDARKKEMTAAAVVRDEADPEHQGPSA